MGYDGIRTWLFFISGFTQRNSQPHGMQRLWLKSHRVFADADTAVMLLPWHTPWAEIAEQVMLCRPGGQEPRIGVSAYSWGAGWGFIRLAEQLQRRGIGIRAAVLSDAVYRSRLLSLTWRSLTRSPWVNVPSNVREVTPFRQANNRPSGHRVIAVNPRQTTIHKYIDMDGVTHENADDYVPFHNKSLEMCAEVSR